MVMGEDQSEDAWTARNLAQPYPADHRPHEHTGPRPKRHRPSSSSPEPTLSLRRPYASRAISTRRRERSSAAPQPPTPFWSRPSSASIGFSIASSVATPASAQQARYRPTSPRITRACAAGSTPPRSAGVGSVSSICHAPRRSRAHLPASPDPTDRIERKSRRSGRCNPPASARSADHSTVTDLARLRGWSTSVPLRTAVW